MFNFLEKMNNPRERAAFIAAFLITLAIGAVWFSFKFSSSQAVVVAGSEVSNVATSTPGPISRIGEKAADTAIFIASRVRDFVELWKKWTNSGSIEYTQKEK
jgi:hypothetical protein